MWRSLDGVFGGDGSSSAAQVARASNAAAGNGGRFIAFSIAAELCGVACALYVNHRMLLRVGSDGNGDDSSSEGGGGERQAGRGLGSGHGGGGGRGRGEWSAESLRNGGRPPDKPRAGGGASRWSWAAFRPVLPPKNPELERAYVERTVRENRKSAEYYCAVVAIFHLILLYYGLRLKFFGRAVDVPRNGGKGDANDGFNGGGGFNLAALFNGGSAPTGLDAYRKARMDVILCGCVPGVLIPLAHFLVMRWWPRMYSARFETLNALTVLASIVSTNPPIRPVNFAVEVSRLTFSFSHFVSFGRFSLPWRSNTSFGAVNLLSCMYYMFVMVSWHAQEDFTRNSLEPSTPFWSRYVALTCLVQLFTLQVGSAVLFRMDLQMFKAQQEAEETNAKLREQAKSLAKFSEARVHMRSLQHSSQLKTQFVANMSHEIRTPLNTLLGAIEILSDDLRRQGLLPAPGADSVSGGGGRGSARGRGEGMEEMLEVMTVSGEHLAKLVNDVLDFSKIEAGKMELEETQVFSPSHLVNEVAGMLGAQAGQKGLRLVVDMKPNLPSLIRSDPMKLKQVLVNLLSNSIKFTKSGSVSLTVSPATPADASAVEAKLLLGKDVNGPVDVRHGSFIDDSQKPFSHLRRDSFLDGQGRLGIRKRSSSARNGHGEDAYPGRFHLQMSVKDTGIGMNSAALSRIFEPFEQANASTTRSFGGTGLGLALSKSLVDIFGGTLMATSKPGEGSTFTFCVGVWTNDQNGAPLQGIHSTGLPRHHPRISAGPELNRYYEMSNQPSSHVQPANRNSLDAMANRNSLDMPHTGMMINAAVVAADVGATGEFGVARTGAFARVSGGTTNSIMPRDKEQDEQLFLRGASPSPRVGMLPGTAATAPQEVAQAAQAGARSRSSEPTDETEGVAAERVEEVAQAAQAGARSRSFEPIDETEGVAAEGVERAGGSGSKRLRVEMNDVTGTDVDEDGGVIGDNEGPISVLFAEDNALNRKILTSQLKRIGNFSVRCVNNGSEALDIMTSANYGEYAFIIMDYQMPVMDGIEATKRIRQLEQELGRPPIAIVGYTASVESAALRRAEEAGMDMVLSKPCSIPKLRALVETMLLAFRLAEDPTATVTQCVSSGGDDLSEHGMSRPYKQPSISNLVVNSVEQAEIVPGLTLSPSRRALNGFVGGKAAALAQGIMRRIHSVPSLNDGMNLGRDGERPGDSAEAEPSRLGRTSVSEGNSAREKVNGGGGSQLTPSKRKGRGQGSDEADETCADLDDPLPMPHKLPDRRRLLAANTFGKSGQNA